MTDSPKFNSPDKHLVSIFTDYNFFSLSLLENLLSKNCMINIVTKDFDEWAENSKHLSLSKFSIIDAEKVGYKHNYGYVIFVGGLIKKNTAAEDLKSFMDNQYNEHSKFLIILPVEMEPFQRQRFSEIYKNIATVYVADFLGPRIDQASDLYMTDILKQIYSNRKIEVGVGEIFYPLFVPDAARLIAKWLFSFGPFGKEVVVLGDAISAPQLWNECSRYLPEIKIITSQNIHPRNLLINLDKHKIEADLHFALGETLKWIFTHWSEQRVQNLPVKRKVKKTYTGPRKQKPIIKKLLITALLFFALPLISMLAASSLIFLGYKSFLRGNTEKSKNYLYIAKTFTEPSKLAANLLRRIPIFGIPYREVYFLANTAGPVIDSGLNAVSLADKSSEMLSNILGEKVYKVEDYALSILSDLGYILRSVDTIEAELKNENNKNLLLSKYITTNVDITRIKKVLSQSEVFAQNLGGILGSGERKSYLVLFQNNMELRPTGGFIGSYGIATFDGGRMTELSVNDIYSADGQLKGHVEPPEPIKAHLGEANWWFRDSNWDPDFPTSAQRAEWFLSKEVDQEVDGVIAIDLTPVESVLKYTGPVFLPDYNLEITSENLYEKTQSEVHDKFFAGSRKKASFLTALSRQLINDLAKINSKERVGILRSFFDSLETRGIQVYLHNEDAQAAISSLGWDGSVNMPSCGQGCYADFVGLTEANVGVNKVNYFVGREADFSVGIKDDKITRTLVVKLTNSASADMGLAGKYKNYIRILVPAEADNISAKSTTGESEQRLEVLTQKIKGRKEIGALVEVLHGQSKSFAFTWETPIQNQQVSKYGLFIRKQAGVGDDPWNLNVGSQQFAVLPPGLFSLTTDGVYGYNWRLSKDFTAVFDLKIYE